MNRIIKFRGYHPDEAKMYYFTDFEDIACFVQGDAYRKVNTPDCMVVYQQFTGLLDKNGKEIYEGDILTLPQNKKHKTEVCWENKGYWGLKWNSEFARIGKPAFATTELEIIGNIYENKELLEVKK